MGQTAGPVGPRRSCSPSLSTRAGKRCLTGNQPHPGLTPLSPTPFPSPSSVSPRALPVQEPATPPGPASSRAPPSPLQLGYLSAYSSAPNSEPQGPETPSPGWTGPAERTRCAELPGGLQLWVQIATPYSGGNSSLRPFLSPDPARFTGASEPPDRSSHSSLGARATSSRRAARPSLSVRGASRKSRGPPCFARRPELECCLLGCRVAAGGFGREGVRLLKTKRD